MEWRLAADRAYWNHSLLLNSCQRRLLISLKYASCAVAAADHVDFPLPFIHHHRPFSLQVRLYLMHIPLGVIIIKNV